MIVYRAGPFFPIPLRYKSVCHAGPVLQSLKVINNNAHLQLNVSYTYTMYIK